MSTVIDSKYWLIININRRYKEIDIEYTFWLFLFLHKFNPILLELHSQEVFQKMSFFHNCSTPKVNSLINNAFCYNMTTLSIILYLELEQNKCVTNLYIIACNTSSSS